jgi:hypothetical protein
MGKVKRRRTTQKVRQKKKDISKTVPVDPQVRARWDASKTTAENYRRLGLTAAPNRQLRRQVEGDALPRVDVNIDPAAQRVRERLAAEKLGPLDLYKPVTEADVEPRRYHWAEGQITLVTALVRKHGTDYAAMERDTKLNYLQHTRKKLKGMCEKMAVGIARAMAGTEEADDEDES